MPTGIWLYSYWGLWILALGAGVLLAAAYRQVAELYDHWVRAGAGQGLPVNAPAPDLPSTDLYGRPIPATPEPGVLRLVLFLSRGCASCRQILQEMGRIASLPGVETVLVVGNRDLHTRLFLEEHRRESAFPGVLAVADFEHQNFTDFDVTATPFGVVVDAEGILKAKSVVNTRRHARRLLREAGMEGLEELESPELEGASDLLTGTIAGDEA